MSGTAGKFDYIPDDWPERTLTDYIKAHNLDKNKVDTIILEWGWTPGELLKKVKALIPGIKYEFVKVENHKKDQVWEVRCEEEGKLRFERKIPFERPDQLAGLLNPATIRAGRKMLIEYDTNEDTAGFLIASTKQLFGFE